MMVLFPDGFQMLETEGGDDFDSDDNDHLRYPIQGHWTALSIPYDKPRMMI